MLDPAIRTTAYEANLGIFTTLMPDGQPQSSVVWPHADERHILITTSTARQKYRNIARDGRATLLMLDQKNPRRYVEVRGVVVAIETGDVALDVAKEAFTKWTGSPSVRAFDGERVLFRFKPVHVHIKE